MKFPVLQKCNLSEDQAIPEQEYIERLSEVNLKSKVEKLLERLSYNVKNFCNFNKEDSFPKE